jgi:LDH2 family malate/lactate/ureidoglycolate dehydrogenase
VVALRSATLAQQLARQHGVGVVAVRGSNHLGALGYYTRLLADRGLVGLAVSGGGPRIAPWGGAEALLATNPWSFGFPAAGRTPIVVDVSNGVVLTGSVDEPASRGERIPFGWALDDRGRPTEDAAAGAAGSLLAFGGAKGTALSLALEMLVSVMTGAAYSRDVPSLADAARPQRLGHFFLTLEVGQFMPPADMYRRVSELLGWVEASRPVDGGPPVRVPGDRGEAVARERRVSGIPLDGRRESLDRLAADLNVPALPTPGEL